MQIKYLILLEDLHTMNSKTSLGQKNLDITHNWKHYIHLKWKMDTPNYCRVPHQATDYIAVLRSAVT
jgi:hypothetical protein